MKRQASSAANWRRLAPLTGVVLAVHLALLRNDWPVTPTRDRWVRSFTTRTIATAPKSVPVAPVAPMTPAPPPPAPRPAPAPAPAPAPPASPAPESKPAPPPPRGGVEAPAPAATPPAAAAPPPAPGTRPLMESNATPFTPGTLAVPQPAVMHYEVEVRARGFTLRGDARLDWWHNGQQYDVKLQLSAPGLRERVQQSTGRITGEGLAPERFSDKNRGEQATHFDRAHDRLVFSNNQPEVPLAAGMQDRLSVVVQLSMLVGGDPAAFPPGTQIAIPTAGTRDAQEWVFRVEGEEDLDLPGGRVLGLKLERLPRKEFDQKVELWLAPRKDYAPVRLRLTNPDGGTVDQRWTSTDRG